jgi:hypothetical protein
MFINLKDQEKNPKKKDKKKSKYIRTDEQTNGHKEGLQNRPRSLPGQNMQRPAEAGSAGELKCKIVMSDGQTDIVNLHIRYS